MHDTAADQPGAAALLTVTTVTAVLTAVLIVLQAGLLAGILSRMVLEEVGAGALAGPLALLTGLVGLRALLAWAQGRLAARAFASIRSRLCRHVLAGTQEPGTQEPGTQEPGTQEPGTQEPDGARPSGRPIGELTSLAGRSLDALDLYFTGYLPQLVLAVVVPVVVLVRLSTADLAATLVIAATLPLVPLCMALAASGPRARRRWRLTTLPGGQQALNTISRALSGTVLGLPVCGLPALRRARTQARMAQRMATARWHATMRTLRAAFLLSVVLELVASLSAALVAVPVGIWLLYGQRDLGTALLVLLLVPEIYLSLRAVGAQWHASMEGLAVSQRVCAVIEAVSRRCPARPRLRRPPPDLRTAEIRLEHVTVRYPDREEPALADVSLVLAAGERMAVFGPSGAGKSTLVQLLLGLVVPERGRVLVDGTDLRDLDLDEWRRQVAWVPQRAHLVAGTVADNIRFDLPGTSMSEVRRAARAAAVDSVVLALPAGYDTLLGECGVGMSASQRQRIVLARTFLRDAPLLLLDEPTAGLEGGNEATVAASLRRHAQGRTVLVVTHRFALTSATHRTVPLRNGRLTT